MERETHSSRSSAEFVAGHAVAAHAWDARALYALLRAPVNPDLVTIDERRTDEEETTRRIRCPLCEWQPDRRSRWYCDECPHPEGFLGGCGTMWNTFETRGRCPGCGHRWRWTSCLACGGWSLHDDWYVDDQLRRTS
jgi:hypothetical protein